MNHNFDILSIIHFILYFLLGLYYKNNYLFVLVIGIVWELFEKVLVSNPYSRYILKEYWFIPIEYIDDTFDHSIIDIIMNMIGYYIGSNIK